MYNQRACAPAVVYVYTGVRRQPPPASLAGRRSRFLWRPAPVSSRAQVRRRHRRARAAPGSYAQLRREHAPCRSTYSCLVSFRHLTTCGCAMRARAPTNSASSWKLWPIGSSHLFPGRGRTGRPPTGASLFREIRSHASEREEDGSCIRFPPPTRPYILRFHGVTANGCKDSLRIFTVLSFLLEITWNPNLTDQLAVTVGFTHIVKFYFYD
jgi:hypothetical protein